MREALALAMGLGLLLVAVSLNALTRKMELDEVSDSATFASLKADVQGARDTEQALLERVERLEAEVEGLRR